jgi:hypothetical protein
MFIRVSKLQNIKWPRQIKIQVSWRVMVCRIVENLSSSKAQNTRGKVEAVVSTKGIRSGIGRGSSVGIATRYGLDDPEIESR